MIEEHIEDFLAYLDINRSMFFSSECEINILFLMMHRCGKTLAGKNYQSASSDYLLRCGPAK